MSLVTERDDELIKGVYLELKGARSNEYASRLYCRIAARAPGGEKPAWLACDIAAAFIRLSEDLKQSNRNLRVEPSQEPTAEPKRDPRVDSLEAQVAANRSRIEELEKQFATLEGSVESLKQRATPTPSRSWPEHPVPVGCERFGKKVVESYWGSSGSELIPIYRLDGESEFRSIGPLEA
jgi:hypothetical protein